VNNFEAMKIIILRDLLEKKGRIASYSLYRRLKIPISEFMKAVVDLQGEGFVIFDGDWLSITNEGGGFLMQSRPHKENNRGIPKGFLREAPLRRDSLYIPSIARLDISLLKK
jgi:hypothetical protein